jgi:isopentenyl-diphosphate Delta-isomerase
MSSERSSAEGGEVDRDEVVVLVDANDSAVGVAPKLDVHRTGTLHRAVSVVLFDDQGRMLLQRRAYGKYHSAGLWSNTCCGHPRPGESVEDAARRRLGVELGIQGCEVARVGEFSYFANLGNGLVEHELDHIVVGRWGGVARPNPAEVAEIRWAGAGDVVADLAQAPATYTVWAPEVIAHALRSRDVDAVSAGR